MRARGHLLLRRARLRGRAVQLDGVPQARGESLRCGGTLGHVVHRARLHELDRHLLIPLAGEHHDRHVDPRLADAPQQGQAVGAGEVVVEEDAVVARRGEARPADIHATRLVDHGGAAGAQQAASYRHAVHVVVIEHEHAQPSVGCGRCGRKRRLGERTVDMHQGISTSVQYLLSAAITSQKLLKVTGFSR